MLYKDGNEAAADSVMSNLIECEARKPRQIYVSLTEQYKSFQVTFAHRSASFFERATSDLDETVRIIEIVRLRFSIR